MSIHFIMGGSGSGKTTRLCRDVIRMSMEEPDHRFLIVVPEQATLQTQKLYVENHPRKGLMNIDVLSFQRLAHRVLEETGYSEKKILRETGKILLLRRAAGEIRNDLKVFGQNFRKLGYVNEMKSLLSELAQYQLEGVRLEEVIELCPESGSLRRKLEDVLLLQEKFHDYMGNAYMTGEELLTALGENVCRSELIQGASLVFDGFTGFTPVQGVLLEELMRYAGELYFSVTIDEREDPFKDPGMESLFHLSQEMVVDICRTANKLHVPIGEPLVMEHPYPRFTQAPGLEYLERKLFRNTVDAAPASENRSLSEAAPASADRNPVEGISVHMNRNPKEEAAFIAAESMRLVREEKVRYRDIAVIAGDMDVYGRHLEEAFQEMGIPYFLDRKKDALFNGCVEFIRAAVFLIYDQYSYESVFRFMKSGFYDVEEREIFLLENFCLAMGVRGYKRWKEEWTRMPKGMDEGELKELNEIRGRFVELLSPLEVALRSRQKTVEGCTRALYDLMVSCQVQEKCRVREELFKETNPALSLEYRQIYKVIMDMLDQFVFLLGEEQVTIHEYKELLDAGLAEIRVGIVPPRQDQITVGDMKRSRIGNVKYVFCAGLNDKYLPGVNSGRGIINDRERFYLKEMGVRLAPDGAEKVYSQRFNLYLNLTRPSRQLFLSYSNVDMTGEIMRPSCYLREIMRIVPGLSVVDQVHSLGMGGLGFSRDMDLRFVAENIGEVLAGDIMENIEGMDVLISAEMDVSDAGTLKDGSEAGDGSITSAPAHGNEKLLIWKELFTNYWGLTEERDRIKKILDAAYICNPGEALTTDQAEKLYGSLIRASATKLEVFASCPYSFFLKYGLRLRERDEYEFKLMDEGTLLHEALKRYGLRLRDEGLAWDGVSDEKRDALCGEIMDELVKDFGNGILESSAVNRYVAVWIRRTLEKTVWALGEQLRAGDFVPEGYELNFGGKEIGAIELPLSDHSILRVTGQIDRLDVAGAASGDDKVYLKILDYKTGNKSLEISSIYYGLDFQLFTYLIASESYGARRFPGAEVVPAGVMYYHIQTPILREDGKAELDEESLKRKLLMELRPDGLVQSDREVLCRFDEGFAEDGYKGSVALRQALKKDGSFTADSKVLSAEEIKLLANRQKCLMMEIGDEIKKGNISVSPVSGMRDGCEYCFGLDTCGFNKSVPGFEDRKLVKRPLDEIVLKLHAETLREETPHEEAPRDKI